MAATVTTNQTSVRSIKQNAAMHLYWTIMSKALNAAGWTKKKYFAVKVMDVDWTPESFGEDVWRGLQEALYMHRKTSKLDKKEVTTVYENVNRHLGNTCGVSAEFPSMDGQMNKSLGRK
jgi:hypothetical protein